MICGHLNCLCFNFFTVRCIYIKKVHEMRAKEKYNHKERQNSIRDMIQRLSL